MGWGGSYGVVCGVVGQLWGAAGCYRQLWGRNGGLGCAMGQLWGSMKPLWGGLGGGCHEAPIGWWWWGGSSGAHRVAVGWMGAMCRGSLWGRALTNPPPPCPPAGAKRVAGARRRRLFPGRHRGAAGGAGGALGGRNGVWGISGGQDWGTWGAGASLWGRTGELGGSAGQDWGTWGGWGDVSVGQKWGAGGLCGAGLGDLRGWGGLWHRTVEHYGVPWGGCCGVTPPSFPPTQPSVVAEWRNLTEQNRPDGVPRSVSPPCPVSPTPCIPPNLLPPPPPPCFIDTRPRVLGVRGEHSWDPPKSPSDSSLPQGADGGHPWVLLILPPPF